MIVPIIIVAALAYVATRPKRLPPVTLVALPAGIPPIPDLPKHKSGVPDPPLSDYEIKMAAWLKDKYKTRFVSYERGRRVWYITLELPPDPGQQVKYGRRFALAADGQTEVPYYDND